MKGVEEICGWKYYGICFVGGMLSSGATHLAITPLDVLKVNMQVYPNKYNNGIVSGLSTIWKQQGSYALWRGWSGKLCGYGIQGGFKYALYEYFKNLYADHLLLHSTRNSIFFLSGLSAQILADLTLAPFEAVKIRLQIQPNFAKGLSDGFPLVYRNEGLPGFYRGLIPLWSRNLPFSMVMFSSFEHSVDLIYKNIVHKRKEDCSTPQQLGVTCFAAYTAGALATVISNPADNVMTSLYKKKAESAMQAIKNIGFINLFTRSLPIRIALLGPVITLQWFLYDTIKVLSGLPTSGGLARDQKEVKL
ncbi:mitochondrial phosphate carrier protein 1, mitochondrial [Lathyrus oleraceus]|uniref:Mitochondrial phosphate carrier protein 1 n=1 Tax=Pisum sativum TaxID=3888 RepID=A0A9D4Y579_PEA|nr:mitochondrial phosphate carrier protein 1, mitochondrial-like [Pisum sativum]KAI5432537.1 Mitochondrial phosphate carrier protein 1 [Pisum sativum]